MNEGEKDDFIRQTTEALHALTKTLAVLHELEAPVQDRTLVRRAISRMIGHLVQGTSIRVVSAGKRPL